MLRTSHGGQSFGSYPKPVSAITVFETDVSAGWILLGSLQKRHRIGAGLPLFKKCRPDWDITRPELKAAWERGERDRFYHYGRTYGQVFREQE